MSVMPRASSAKYQAPDIITVAAMVSNMIYYIFAILSNLCYFNLLDTNLNQSNIIGMISDVSVILISPSSSHFVKNICHDLLMSPIFALGRSLEKALDSFLFCSGTRSSKESSYFTGSMYRLTEVTKSNFRLKLPSLRSSVS
jgi:hypothetical protein